MIKVEKLNVKVKNNFLLKNVSFNIEKGVKCSLIGANGAGKTSLMNALLNINENYEGTIKLNNINAKEFKCHKFIEFIPADSLTFNTKTKRFLIDYYLLQENNIKNALDRINYLANFFKFSDFLLEKKISKLSSGEKQIVKIILAFLFVKEIIILDEPTNYLDFRMKALLFKLIKSNEFKNTTFLISSHEILELKENTEYVIYLQNGEVKFTGK
jgi:ABC-type multidrug transport system ATPase subunit